MKFKIVSVILVMCIAVICVTSCNKTTQNINNYQPNEFLKEGENEKSESAADQLKNDTDKMPVGDSIPLIFSNYDDFILFATKGKLDPEKHSNSDFLIRQYKLNKGVFVDVKNLFGFSNIETKGWTEEVVVSSSNEFSYYLYSLEDSNRLKPECRITVSYDFEGSRSYHSSIVNINRLSDMDGVTGDFLYKTNEFDVIYHKTTAGYKSFVLSNGNLSINVFLYGDGFTSDQISLRYGKVLSNYCVNEETQLNELLVESSSAILKDQKQVAVN